jgi:Carbohydrate binding domain 30
MRDQQEGEKTVPTSRFFRSSRAAWRRPLPGLAALAAVLLGLALPAPARSAQKPEFLVWDFDQAITNRLGGEYNAFARNPSWARTYLDPSANPPLSKFSLRITAHRASEGFCGVWFDFYPKTGPNAHYLGALAYRYLSFWVRGAKGGEDFDLTLKDDTWLRHEDDNPTVSLHTFLPAGAPTEWRRVLIPLSDFQGLNRGKIYDMSLKFSTPGDYRVYLDSIGFTTGPGATESASAAPPSTAISTHSAGAGRGLWVWETDKLLGPDKKDEADRFFQFCAGHQIRDVFLSIKLDRQKKDGTPHDVLLHPASTREFLARAHRAGLRVEALAGTPEWAATANHPRALAAIEAVEAFNREGAAEERFDGAHFDVEPYLLVGYADPAFRPNLLKQYLELIAQCVARAHSAGLTFSCDVPAWFYPAHEAQGQELQVDFEGKLEPVGEHLSDLLDTVTIMDYHNEADGAGGIIAAGLPALAYAEKLGKKIRVGLETSREPDRVVYFAAGLPVAEFRKRLTGSDLGEQFARNSWRLRTFSDGTNIHVGLEAPPLLEGEVRQAFLKALGGVARQFGASSDPQRFPPAPILEEARNAMKNDADWTNFELFHFTDAATGSTIEGFQAVHGMPAKVTFQGLGREVFEEESRSAVEWLSPYASFDGLAIHYYGSYATLLETR